jgi:uncharacterized protein
MPVQPTYPGVYIEELPSGVRTITGVATSITAFIGRALRGPTDKAVTINSYGDFERIFGGLWVGSALGYAVRDFYLNGGSQAIIVRLVSPGSSSSPLTSPLILPATKAGLGDTNLSLEAANEGTWGNSLRARVDYQTSDPTSLFNLFVRDGLTGQIEVFRNLSITPGNPRQVDKVLENGSNLVRWSGPLLSGRPSVSTDPTDPAKSVWDDNIPSTNSKVTTIKGSDGDFLTEDDFIGTGKEGNKEGLYRLAQVDLFNLLCIPPYRSTGDVNVSVVTRAAVYCEQRRAMLIVDPPSEWGNKAAAKTGIASGVGTTSKNAALFFPRLRQPDPLHDNQMDNFAPCGAVAGVFARTDAQRGVWKAPAGLDATLVGVPALSVPLTDAENGELNPLGINCLRIRPAAGPVVWGSRTLQGDDSLASEWKYIPVRRLALYLEESLYRGTQWVVFEPNDEPLWAQIRLNLGAFMHTLFRQGAFQGKSPRDAYLVKCDKETTTQDDINRGVVNILVGFAPLKPAEFVIIQIQQLAGQVQT